MIWAVARYSGVTRMPSIRPKVVPSSAIRMISHLRLSSALSTAPSWIASSAS